MSSGSTAGRGRAAPARRAVAIWMGKMAGAVARRLRRDDSGIAGRVALAIDRDALSGLAADLPRGSIVVTGSAGKGTTCDLLAHVMRAAGLQTVLTGGDCTARAGLAAAMVAQARPTGHLRNDRAAIGLLAADVDAVADLVRHAPALGALVCTNLFRDDRERGLPRPSAAATLERAIGLLPGTTALILNADDPQVACLAAAAPNPRLYFGVSDPAHGRIHADPAATRLRCPRCNGRLSYARVYYGHLGDWACDSCGLSRPRPDVSATKIWMSGSPVMCLEVATAAGSRTLELPLPGLHNCYNALAAAAAATHRQVPMSSLAAAGACRMERICVAGHDVYLAGVRDATGFTATLRAVLGAGEPRHLLLGVDDNAAKRGDPGWLWDVDFDSLAGLAPALVVCGSRAADLAVRLKYAGWLGDAQDLGESAGAIIEPDVIRAARVALATIPAGQPLWVISSPGCLSDLRRWLRRSSTTRDQERQDRAVLGAGPVGPHPTGPHPTGPHPTGPRPVGPQPSRPPRDGRRPGSRRSRDRRRYRQSGQTGGGR